MFTNELLQDISKGSLKSLYLIYGDNDFLKSHTARTVRKDFFAQNPMASLDFTAKEKIEIVDFKGSMETYPLGGRRILMVNTFDTDKDTGEKLLKVLGDIPDFVTIIFVAPDVDKRTKLFKFIQKNGVAVELNTLKEPQLIQWVTATAQEKGKTVSTAVVKYFIQYCGNEMFTLNSEMEKLFSSTLETKISESHINAICTKSAEFNIFELTEAIGSGKIAEAVEISKELLLTEPVVKTIVMIFNQFKNLYQIKNCLNLNMSKDSIAKSTSIHPYVVTKTIPQCKSYTLESLKNIIRLCLEADIAIKSGQLQDEVALEVLISEIGGVNK